MEFLNQEELRRVHQALRRRAPVDPTANVLAIGFGQALRDSKPDSERPFAACYYVRRKLKRVSRARAIPSEVQLRFRRNNHYIAVKVPSDVIESPRYVAGGGFVTHGGGFRLGSVGVLVAWKRARDPWKWGLVTVGHLFRAGSVNVAIQATFPGAAFPVTILYRARPRELLDTALLEVDRGVLTAAGVQVPTEDPPIGDYWTRANLATLVTESEDASVPLPGVSFRPEGDNPKFATGHYFPQTEGLIPDLGNLVDVVQVRSTQASTPAAFIPGTSGSAWHIAGRAAAVQIGHDFDTSSQGLGQFLDTQLVWVRSKLEKDGPLTYFRFIQTY